MAFNINKDLNFGLFSVSQKIGPVTAVIDKVFRKSGPTQEEAEALSEANDQARAKRQNDTVSTPGWPFFNHAQDRRRTRGFGSEGQMVVPRMKFTWLVEFRIDEAWLNSGQMITSLKSGNFIRDGAIYIPVKTVDHPQVNFDIETLRSANRYVKLPKKMEYQPASMTFDDDTTSLIASLRKEYIHFYHHAGDIGQRMGVNSTAPLDEETAINEYQFRSTGMISALGEDVRTRMTEHPSIGMRMRSDCSKHFFQEIVLYDLGMHRDSINAYYFYHPVVTAWGHDGLDYEDRQGKVSIDMQFEYEGYYDVLGQNNAKVESVLFNYFGFAIPIANRTNDHPTMIEPSGKDQELRTCMTPSALGVEGEVPPQIDCTELGDPVKLRDDLTKLAQANTSGFVDGSATAARQEEIVAQLQAITDCENAQTPCSNEDTADAAERTKTAAAEEVDTSCEERNANRIFGADDNIELNFTDDEILQGICGKAAEGTEALDGTVQKQTETIQLTQKVIGDLNNEIEDFQFELNQTPISDPTRIAQLEQAIADNEQRVVDLTAAIDVRTNMISFALDEQGLVGQGTAEAAPSEGCDGTSSASGSTSPEAASNTFTDQDPTSSSNNIPTAANEQAAADAESATSVPCNRIDAVISSLTEAAAANQAQIELAEGIISNSQTVVEGSLLIGDRAAATHHQAEIAKYQQILKDNQAEAVEIQSEIDALNARKSSEC